MDYSQYWAYVGSKIEGENSIGPLLDTDLIKKNYSDEVANAASSYSANCGREEEPEAVAKTAEAAAVLMAAGIDPEEFMTGSSQTSRTIIVTERGK